MKKLTNNQKAFIGCIVLIFAWMILPNFFDFFWGILFLMFIFTFLGGYLIWPMAKDIDKFNNMHNKRF